MDAITLLRQEFRGVHAGIEDDLAAVEPDWLFWQPGPGMNHIGFLAWHIARDEDVVVAHVTRREQVWTSSGRDKRLGMDAREQGTGLSQEGMAAIRYELPELLAYAREVWHATDERLATLMEAELERRAWQGSEWNVGQQLVEGCLGHAWLHLGEIRATMGLRGWRFRE